MQILHSLANKENALFVQTQRQKSKPVTLFTKARAPAFLNILEKQAET